MPYRELSETAHVAWRLASGLFIPCVASVLVAAITFLAFLVGIPAVRAESLTPRRQDHLPVALERRFNEFLESGAQDKHAWFRFVESVRDRIFLNQEVQQIRVHPSRPAPMLHKYALSPGVPPDSEQAHVLCSHPTLRIELTEP
jgi:hypothetical protein